MIDVDKSTIFVSIPAYRDVEITPTIESLFSQATNPGRIRVSICWQYKQDAENATPDLPENHVKYITLQSYEINESEGVCWARSKASAAYDGEDFSLCIDSHMRFVKGWDVLLIQEWQKCKDGTGIQRVKFDM